MSLILGKYFGCFSMNFEQLHFISTDQFIQGMIIVVVVVMTKLKLANYRLNVLSLTDAIKFSQQKQMTADLFILQNSISSF